VELGAEWHLECLSRCDIVRGDASSKIASVKVQKRNRALVKFDSDRICKVILARRGSPSAVSPDFLPGVTTDFQRAGIG